MVHSTNLHFSISPPFTNDIIFVPFDDSDPYLQKDIQFNFRAVKHKIEAYQLRTVIADRNR